MRWHRRHPELDTRQDALLRSLNARLGELLRHSGAPDPGEDLEPLAGRWLDDCFRLTEALAEAMPDTEEME